MSSVPRQAVSPSESSGVLLVDKPEGPTSREVLDALEARLGVGALGHSGTLDPLASGLLVALAGSARKLQDLLMAAPKVYRASVRLGWTSDTYDAEGGPRPTGSAVPELDDATLAEVLRRFQGEIEQVPPAHSALHVSGRRAYRLARRGEPFELPPRRVRIDEIRLLHREADRLDLEITCGPGTYIRSLARDLGAALGCGAYLASLRRIRSGRFHVDEGIAPDVAERAHLLKLDRVLASYARFDADDQEMRLLCQGAWISARLPAGEQPAFAWFADRPFCRLRAIDEGRIRSDLLLFDPRTPRARSEREQRRREERG